MDTLKHPEYQYLNLLSDILENGEEVENRTGVNTIRILGAMHKYDFKHGFPLLTTKKVWFKGVKHELLWFLSGSTNIKYLVDNGVNIWNDDAYRYYLQTVAPKEEGPPLSKDSFIYKIKAGCSWLGDLGPVYGKQWRNFAGDDGSGNIKTVDQISQLIDRLRNNPSSRRHILNGWNATEVDQMALPCCHVLSQFSISRDRLWCQMYQRSCDTFLGIPFNIASYSLLTYMIAHMLDIEPGGFIWTGHDVHIYKNHISAVKEQLTRQPTKFPSLYFISNNKPSKIEDFSYDNIKLANYDPHPSIKADLVT